MTRVAWNANNEDNLARRLSDGPNITPTEKEVFQRVYGSHAALSQVRELSDQVFHRAFEDLAANVRSATDVLLERIEQVRSFENAPLTAESIQSVTDPVLRQRLLELAKLP